MRSVVLMPTSAVPQLRRLMVLAMVLLAAVLAAACASVAPPTAQEQVRQRASQRWQLLMSKNMDAAHKFATPGFRAIVSADTYRLRFGAAPFWLAAEVVRVDCPAPDKCIATVRLDIKPVMLHSNAEKITTHMEEIWLLEQGQWWILENIKGS